MAEAYSRPERTIDLYAVSLRFCGHPFRLRSRKASFPSARETTLDMWGSQLRCSLMFTPRYAVSVTRFSSTSFIV